jgi:AraC-like DNA-binding protein
MRRPLAPGRVVCGEPGEMLVTSEVRRPGVLKVLLIAQELIEAALLRAGRSYPQFRPVAQALRVSDTLAQRLASMIADLESAGETRGLSDSLDALLDSVVLELFRAERPDTCSRRGPQSIERTLDHLRAVLLRAEDVDGSPPDLTALSKQAGLSRFQTLRLFRRHYGVTPHAYQLHFRIALARRSLMAGQNAAEAAASHGFADQSHLTKHFKRLVGITPGQYARSR